jgi:hypothetical protein
MQSQDEYASAARLMIEIGKKGELLDQLQYHRWPLFEEFRGRVEFQNAYESIYGIPFRDKVSREAQQKLDTEKTQAPLKVDEPRTKSATKSRSAPRVVKPAAKSTKKST